MHILAFLPSDQRIQLSLFILVLSFFLLYLIYTLHHRWVIGQLKSSHYLVNSLIEELYWPAIFSILLWSFHVLTDIIYMTLEEDSSSFLIKVSWRSIFDMKNFFLVIWIAWFFLGLINFFEKYLIHIRFFKKIHLHIIGKLLRLFTLSLIFLIALPFFGIETSRFLFFGGGSALIFGLAIQPLMRNYLGGLMVYMDYLFEEGHEIRVKSKDIEGQVERIGWRSTRIEASDGGILYIPNEFFSSVSVVNLSKQRMRRFDHFFVVDKKSQPKIKKMTEAIQHILQKTEGIAQGKEVLVYLSGQSPKGLKVSLSYYTNIKKEAKQKQLWESAFFKILDFLEKEKIPLYESYGKKESKCKKSD